MLNALNRKSNKISNVADPTAGGDASTKNYVDNISTVNNALNFNVDGIPVFISNTGNANFIAYANEEGLDATWRAFNGNQTTGWRCNGALPVWVQLKMTKALIVQRVLLFPSSNDWTNYTITASNDGTTFTTLYSGTTIMVDNSNYYIDFPNTNAHTYYRATLVNGNAGNWWD